MPGGTVLRYTIPISLSTPKLRYTWAMDPKNSK